MKIVMFTDAYWPRVNGVTVSVESFSRALIRLGNEVMIICPFYPESSVVGRISAHRIGPLHDKQEPQIIRVPSMPLILSKEDRIAKFHKWFWVSKQIEQFKPDIIHINTEFVIAEFGFQYAWLHTLPTVYTYHTLWEDYVANYIPLVPTFLLRFIIQGISKNILKRAQAVIVPTLQIQEVIKKYGIKKNNYLLPTGIEPQLFNRDAGEVASFRELLIQKYPPLAHKRILLFAGRIAKEKNIDFLLAIAPVIIAKHPEVVFLLAGNGPDLYYYQEECARLGIETHCIFTGYLDREDLALTYRVSDIFVFPSLTETQGLVTIEAMFSGIPVVAIGAMGTLMVMDGNKGGFMVKNDPQEFTRRVFDLLEDRALYERKAAEAKIHAREWSIDTLAVKLQTIYRDTLTDFQQDPRSRRFIKVSAYLKRLKKQWDPAGARQRV
ncbi:MAG: glycosyltransferase [Treponema sp.]|jgi:glycosyltransferase involved in cell wall biosynthesis|nr:glycosyltransferase [Treponema sp.]